MQPLQHDAPVGPVFGLISGAIANSFGWDTVATVATAFLCGAAGYLGQLLIKKISHAYHAKRNEKRG